MKSVRKGMRSGDLEKDNYERLTCADCGEVLVTEDDPEMVGKRRTCPSCDREWEELG